MLYISVSTYNRRDRCEKKARVFPAIGLFVVELFVPDDAAVEITKTLDNGHFSLHGDPDLLLSFCVADTCLEVPTAQPEQTFVQPTDT